MYVTQYGLIIKGAQENILFKPFLIQWTPSLLHMASGFSKSNVLLVLLLNVEKAVRKKAAVFFYMLEYPSRLHEISFMIF